MAQIRLKGSKNPASWRFLRSFFTSSVVWSTTVRRFTTYALVGLTIRYKTDDQLWFTFFHEIAHILLHRERQSFVIDNAAEDVGDGVVDPAMAKYEEEANRFATEMLIPPVALSEFLRRQTFTNESIHDFAESIDIGPGIVVGRLQHDGILKRHQGNRLKQKLDWKFVSEG